MAGKITIIDYGMGNLKSVAKAFEHVGASVEVTSDPNRLKGADKLVLPGVGSFGHCLEELKRLGLDDAIKEQVQQDKPFLGICLGLQTLFEGSEESPQIPGLGLIKGRVRAFDREKLKVPHMGWNELMLPVQDPCLKGLESGDHMYFVHSFYVDPIDTGVAVALCDYGQKFCAAIRKDNIFACQFHPEKSQENGLKLIENFAKS